MATFAMDVAKSDPNRKARAAGYALLGLAVSVLGNDLAGDYLESLNPDQPTRGRVFAVIDVFAWGLALGAVIKLLRKGPADDVIDLLKEACGGIVPLIEEALVWGAIADTSATLAFGFAHGKYDGAI